MFEWLFQISLVGFSISFIVTIISCVITFFMVSAVILNFIFWGIVGMIVTGVLVIIGDLT